MSFIILVSFVTIPVLVIAEEDIRAAYFVSCSLVFVICMSVLGFIFGPKIWAGASQKVTRDAIKSSMSGRKQSPSCTSSTSAAFSDRSSLNEGALILEHPKTNEEIKAELAELRKLKEEWTKTTGQNEQAPETSVYMPEQVTAVLNV